MLRHHRFKGYKWLTGYRWLAGVSLLSLLTGCAIGFPGARPDHMMPAPVSERGMTLLWGSEVKQQVLWMMNHSRQRVYVDIYELSDADILTALLKAHHRRLDVRVVVDATESHSQTVAVPTLERAGVPIVSFRVPRGISHIKMVVSDAGVLIGGMNFGSQSWLNNDGSVYIRQPNASFLALFRWDWQRAQGIPTMQPNYIPPLLDDRQTEQAVVSAITQAQQAVDVEAFDLSDKAVVSALDNAAQRGIPVEVLLDPGQYYNRKSANSLRDAGVTIRFYRPYGGEWMHAKMLDVDHGAVFIIGSANFSHQAYTYNHEGDIMLTHVPAFSKAFEDNLSLQISRGTDFPLSKKRYNRSTTTTAE